MALPALPPVHDVREVLFSPRGYALWRGRYYTCSPAPDAAVIQGPWGLAEDLADRRDTRTDQTTQNGDPT